MANGEWPPGSVGDGTEFGYDCSAMAPPLIDLNMAVQQTGYVSLGESLFRRLISPLGSLFYDEDYGFDVREWINETGDYARMQFELGSLVAAECEKDPRVRHAEAYVTPYDFRTGRIEIMCQLSEGLVSYLLEFGDPTPRTGEGLWDLSGPRAARAIARAEDVRLALLSTEIPEPARAGASVPVVLPPRRDAAWRKVWRT